MCSCTHAKRHKVYEEGVCYKYVCMDWGKAIKRKWICKQCYTVGYELVFNTPPKDEWEEINRKREQFSLDKDV